jgi:hypothetical protein
MSTRRTRVRTSSATERIVETLELQVATEVKHYVEKGLVRVDATLDNADVEYFVSKYEKGDLIVDPELRREYSWDAFKASKFIESVYLGYPVPPIYAVLEPDSRERVIDGFHRLETLRRYIRNEFRPTGIVEPLNNKLFGRLSESVQRAFLKKRLSKFTVMITRQDPALPESEFNKIRLMIVYDLFRRINLGAKPLTFAQIVFCGVKTDTVKMVKELSELPDYLEIVGPLTESEKRTMTHRVVLLLYGACLYKGKLINFFGTGKTRRVSDLADFLFKADAKTLSEIKNRMLETIKTAREIGISKKLLVLATYGIKTQQKLSTALTLLTLWTIDRLAHERDRAALVRAKDRVVKAFEEFYMRLLSEPALKQKYLRMTHAGDQEALAEISTKLLEHVSRAL